MDRGLESQNCDSKRLRCKKNVLDFTLTKDGLCCKMTDRGTGLPNFSKLICSLKNS